MHLWFKRSALANKALLVMALYPIAACSGMIAPDSGATAGGSGGAATETPAGGPTEAPGMTPSEVLRPGVAPAFAVAKARRLTPAEINNSVRDIFFAGQSSDQSFPAEYFPHQFDNQYHLLSVSNDFVEAAQSASEAWATEIAKRLPTLLPCAASPPAKAQEQACVKDFIARYGTRVYRRPLSSDEKIGLEKIFSDARTSTDFPGSIATVAEALLQSPHFLFRTEYGTGAATAGVVRLSGYEIATALSYFLWHSAPDESALKLAEEGALDTAAGVKTLAGKMMADPRGREGLSDFFIQWLELTAPGALTKADQAATPAMRSAMLEEARLFVKELFADGKGRLDTLLTGTKAHVNAELARIYDIQLKSSNATDFSSVNLDETKRAGFLTLPAFLASHNPGSGTSPIRIGLFVRAKLFCENFPPPPDVIPPPPSDPGLSTRERFAAHSESAACSGCHSLMDPAGFGFERYDGMGRYREFEQAGSKRIPLTGAGELVGTDVDGTFVGPVELAKKLLGSSAVRSCIAAHVKQSMLGATTRENLHAEAEASTWPAASGDAAPTFHNLIVSFVGSDEFLFRKPALD